MHLSIQRLSLIGASRRRRPKPRPRVATITSRDYVCQRATCSTRLSLCVIYRYKSSVVSERPASKPQVKRLYNQVRATREEMFSLIANIASSTWLACVLVSVFVWVCVCLSSTLALWPERVSFSTFFSFVCRVSCLVHLLSPDLLRCFKCCSTKHKWHFFAQLAHTPAVFYARFFILLLRPEHFLIARYCNQRLSS